MQKRSLLARFFKRVLGLDAPRRTCRNVRNTKLTLEILENRLTPAVTNLTKLASYASLQLAIDEAGSGDVLALGRGDIYADPISSAKNLTLQAEAGVGELPKLLGGAAVTAGSVGFSGLRFENAGVSVAAGAAVSMSGNQFAGLTAAEIVLLGAQSDDHVILTYDASQVHLNFNGMVSSVTRGELTSLQVLGFGGDDTLEIQNSNSTLLPLSIDYDGGSQTTPTGDRLVLSGGGTQIYHIGSTPGTGSGIWESTRDGVHQFVHFTDLEPILVNDVPNLVLNDTDDSHSITITANSGFLEIAIPGFESVFVAQSEIEMLTVNAEGGDDVVLIDFELGASLLNQVSVNGGTGDDTFEILSHSSRVVVDGGAGDDTYVFDLDLATSNTDVTLIEADPGDTLGGGNDTLDFSLTTGSIGLYLEFTFSQFVASNLLLTLSSGVGFENVLGGAGNDFLFGNSLDNSIAGGPGDDLISGGGGNDTLAGEEGSDTYDFSGFSDLGSDLVIEAAGCIDRDELDFSGMSEPVHVDLASVAPQAVNSLLTIHLSADNALENLFGTFIGNDTLLGNACDNFIVGASGDDSIQGLAGNDTLIGDLRGDPDYYEGEYSPGNDTLNGGAGNDSMVGDLGDDTYVFTPTDLGNDSVDEQSGCLDSDTLDFSALSRGVVVDLAVTAPQAVSLGLYITILTDDGIENVMGSQVGDMIRGNACDNLLEGLAGDDILEGRAGNDTTSGGTGNDTYVYTGTTLGSDRVIDSPGCVEIDTLDFSGQGATAVKVNLALTTPQIVNSNITLELSSSTAIERVIGTAASDVILGNDCDNVLLGFGGADFLQGMGGNDVLYGGEGNDTVLGDDGNDEMHGDAGNDFLVAGAGNDTLLGGDGNDTLTTGDGNDSAVGGAGLDRLFGQGGNDTLRGGSGNDTVLGGDGNDALFGDDGNDCLLGGAGNDVARGGSGNDSVVGDEGADTLFGDLGNDTLRGGAGNDVLQGFAGNDCLGANGRGAGFLEEAGNDTLLGGDGNDSMDGGLSNDYLRGGLGLDVYYGGHETARDTLNGRDGGFEYMFFPFQADLSVDIVILPPGQGQYFFLNRRTGLSPARVRVP